MRHTRFFRFVAIAFLGLCVSFLLRLSWTSVAFGQANLQSTLNEAEKNYICFSASREYPISEFRSFTQNSIQTNIVQKLAKQLSSCVLRNQNQLGSVDLSKLLGVTYTTQLLNNGKSAVVIAGVGKRNANGINLTSGLDNYSSGMANFLVENANLKDFSVTLKQRKFSNQVDKELLNLTDRFGKLVLHAKGSLEFSDKLRLSGNKASIEASLGIQHQIKDVPTLPPHVQLYFKGDASDQNVLSNRSRKLGSVELMFNGLLLKGVPAYLEQNRAKLERNGLVLKTDYKRDNSQATLSRTIEIAQETQLNKNIAELRSIESKLRAKQTKVLSYLTDISNLKTKSEQARTKGNTELAAKLEERLKKAETNLKVEQANLQKDIANKYQKLAKLPLQAKFICAPEFMREFKFPIFERRASSSGQGGNASAGIGVSGDVVIDISKPTCEFIFAPPFKGQSSTYADVSVTSNGYLGGRADASGEKDFGITFSKSKQGSSNYGNFNALDPKLLQFTSNEKKAINDLVLKSLEDAKNDEKVLNDLANKFQEGFIDPLISSVESSLIGSDNAPFSALKLCSSLFNKIGITSDSEEELVCKAANTNVLQPSKILETVTQKQQELQDRVKFLEDNLSSLDSEIQRLNEKLASKACKLDLTGLCKKATSAAFSTAENTKNKLNAEKNSLTNQLSNLQVELVDLTQAWEQYNNWLLYRTSQKVREVAKKVLSNRILRNPTASISRSIAKDLLDLAWDIETGVREVNSFIDNIAKYLQPPGLPESLTISAAASGRIGFRSQAHIVETRPQLTTTSELEFKDKKPLLNLKFVAYRNGPEGEKGRIGGLDVTGLTFTAKQIACLGGKVQGDSCSSGKKIDDIPEKNWSLLAPTLADDKLSKNEIEIFSDSVPLQFKS